MNARAMTKPFAILTAFAAAAALAACSPQKASPPTDLQGVDIAGTPIGGPFTLTDKDGKRVSWDQFKGQYRMVYFGYTFCPDACPMDMGAAMQGYVRFAKDHPKLAEQIQPIFITVDPERDTPARVGEFAAAFHPRVLGLTGSRAEIDAAIKAFKVVAVRGKDVTGGYLMDHSRAVYLFDRDGKPLVTLPVDKGGEAVASDLAKVVH